jgi:6-pyruvoyltetrahydropterin/6-carboxytetrahydropterin synthase
MTAAVTRTYRFSASHRLHTAALSDTENKRLFGKCNNPFGHGHNYELEITVRGVIGEETGIVISIRQLDRYVLNRVVHDFDASNMNLDIPEFREVVPTTENLTRVVAHRLKSEWDGEFGCGGPRLARVHVQETARNGFELIVEERMLAGLRQEVDGSL